MTITAETLDTNIDSNLDPIYLNEELDQDSCLVLCIEEHDTINGLPSIDTRMFISYNEEADVYIVNGKRLDLLSSSGRNRTNFQPFMFCGESSNDIMDFIALTLNTKGNFSYTLYNYNNLSYDLSEVTYTFMEQNMDKRYEISAFDGLKYSRKKFRQLVRLTRTVYN